MLLGPPSIYRALVSDFAVLRKGVHEKVFKSSHEFTFPLRLFSFFKHHFGTSSDLTMLILLAQVMNKEM